MYAGKSLELLIEAASGVHAADPAFRLLMVGDGPSRAHAQAASEGLEFIRWLGVQRGTEKAALMAVSDFMLMPGSIGLAIVDAFTAGLPLLATEAPGHGPELAYLVPGSNGALTRADAASYIAIIRELLGNPQQLHRWRRQAASDGQRYSVEGMAERFGQGILDALAHPRL